jgi:predicted dehydrogenase|tara:strand:- start:2483 stop:3511 length:1029 start_codon:yes stop_codon:yes gene_type:complete
MAKLRCGIVGYGYMGEIRKRVIESIPELELVGVVETNHNKWKQINHCLVFDSFDALIQTEVDAVFVATPNIFAPDLCIKSLDFGKHVFCEKPPGRTFQDIKRISEAESRNPSCKLKFGFNHRFHPAVMKAKAVVESGRLGKILSLRGIYGKSGGKNYLNSWRNQKKVSGGGILLDQGIHMLDLFRYFCGDFEAVKCFINNSYWNLEVEDNAYVILENQKGQNAVFHSSATLWKHTFQLDLLLENGYLIVEGLLSKTGSYGRERLIIGKRQFEDEAEALGNPSEEMICFDRDLSWTLEVQSFIKCILNDLPVTVSSSHDALKVMELIDLAYQDATKNKQRCYA